MLSVHYQNGAFLCWLNANSYTHQELDALRKIPSRHYHKTSGHWSAPPTRKNAEYLMGLATSLGAQFSREAQAAAHEITQGPIHKKGALPEGFVFKTTPRPYQLEALLRMRVTPNYGLLMDPGTGKSKILIDDTSAQFLEGKINAHLLLCPNGIKGNWLDELGIHSSVDYEAHVYDSTKKGAALQFIRNSRAPLKWLIMGIESLSSGTGWEVAREFLALSRAIMSIDESSRIKTHNNIRTEKCLQLGPLAVSRHIASGTSVVKGLNEAWAQFEFLDPNILGRGYYAFRNYFCVMGGYKQKQIMGSQNEDEFIDLVSPHVFRASKSELDLPPKTYQVRRVTMSPEQAKLYRALDKEGLAIIDGRMSTYTNALVRDLRLQQITSGFIFTEPDPTGSTGWDEDALVAFLEKGRTEPIPGPNPKLRELMDCLEEEPSRVIIWCRFRPEIDLIQQALAEKYGPESVVVYHGGVPEEARGEARRRFKADPTCKYFVGQIRTGGIGLTLVTAPSTYYFSNSWSAEDRIQSEDRNHRIGQTQSVNYVDILFEGKTIDSRIQEAVRQGMDYHVDFMERVGEAQKRP